jgi:hypothetical protein
MAQKFLFIRHGRSKDDRVTIHGWLDLANIRDKLKDLEFNPAFSISSTENRCIETAFFLSRGIPAHTFSSLHAYGDLEEVGVVVPSKKAEQYTAYVWGASVLKQILNLVPPERDVVVCGHDYMPNILAKQLLNLNSNQILKVEDFEDIAFPNEGEGVLVEENNFHILRLR